MFGYSSCMHPIAAINQAGGGKEQGFEKENTTAIDPVQKQLACGDFVSTNSHTKHKLECRPCPFWNMPIPLRSGSRKRKKIFL